MSGTTTIVYNGPFRDGLELTEALGFGYIHIPYAKPIDLPTEVAVKLLEERPDEFHRPKAKPRPKVAAKKAAAKAAAPVTDPAAADTEES